jgi:hypothetical protein
MAAFVAIAGGTAEATGLIHTSNIAKGAVTLNRLSPHVRELVTAMPQNGVDGTKGIDGIPGAPGVTGATGATGTMGLTGAKGKDGTNGMDGANGVDGLPGADGDAGAKGKDGTNGVDGQPGAKGDIGPMGPAGEDGTNGTNGKDGKNGVDAPAPAYGAAMVYVSRSGKDATEWARYSTRLGSPVGDTTSGSFRFTCSDAQAPCTVGVRVATLSDAARNVLVRPRVLIDRQDYNAGGPQTYCEYGDGVTNGNPFATVATQTPSATPVLTALTMGVGSSDDCGIAGPGGTVSVITVPSGYYNVHASFLFI